MKSFDVKLSGAVAIQANGGRFRNRRSVDSERADWSGRRCASQGTPGEIEKDRHSVECVFLVRPGEPVEDVETALVAMQRLPWVRDHDFVSELFLASRDAQEV